MGARGPSPKPTGLRILQGNQGKIKINNDEPKPAVAPIDCAAPDWLDELAQDKWRELRPVLIWLTVADLDMLAAYCHFYSLWRRAAERIEEEGDTFVLREPVPEMAKSRKRKKPALGAIRYVQQAPQVAIASKYFAQMRQCGGELGLSPAARTRIRIPDATKSKKDESLFFAAESVG